MDKTIEKPFLKAFDFGEVVHNCISAIGHKYDLGYMPKITPEEEEKRLAKLSPEERKEQLEADRKWQHIYDVKYPEIIKADTDAFDDTVIMYNESPLIEEIEKNLLECSTQKEKDRYIFSLLKPFKEFSDIYHPKAEIDRLKADIAECEKDKAMWEGMPEDKPLKDRTGKSAGTPREQAKACESFIDRYKEEIERCYYINRRFIEITCQPDEESEQTKTGTVEWCLRAFVGVENMFANKLDALLLTYGIDLMRLQKESGIYLKSYRLITDVDFYIGSMELAQKYIDELPKDSSKNDQTTSEPQQKKQEPPHTLPRKLKDDEAKSLRALLINQKQIATGTEEEIFLYWFGCGKYREGIKPITWTGTKQIARELLEGLYKSEDSSFADIEKTVHMCFMKDGKPMKLAKNKKVPSLGSDAIANFLATIKKN